MSTLSRVFHLTYVVDDLDSAVQWLVDVLGGEPLGTESNGPVGNRLRLVQVGDIVLMPMTPSPSDPGNIRFRNRFGQHIHSVAWFVPDLSSLVAAISSRGVPLRDERGRPVDHLDADDIHHEIWTLPRRAPILVELFPAPPPEGDGRLTDPRFAPGWDMTAWSDHPLGLRRTACLTMVTSERPEAVAFFTDILAGDVIGEIDATPWSTRSTFVQIGPYTVVEVAEPVDEGSRAAADLAANGPILHALTFEVSDLERTGSHLAAAGVRLDRAGPSALSVDPGDTPGLLLRFTDRPLI